MKYKLVAMDMDGTLLNSKGAVTIDTLYAIKKAKEEGIIFTIATGRPVSGVARFLNMLDFTAPVITYNGAMLIDPTSKKILFKKDLLAKDAVTIYNLGLSLNQTMCIWANNNLYSNRDDEKLANYKKISGNEPIIIDDINEIAQSGVTKILWYDDAEKISVFKNTIDPNIFESVTFTTSQPHFLEFFNSEVSKGVALDKLAKELGIKQEEVVAFGDGLNDLPMIEYAGMGIAMENGHKELRDAAQYVTLSNDDDGIAYAIYNVLIKNAINND